MNLSRRLITLKSNLGTAAIGFYIVETAEKPILTTFSANSFGNLVSSILFVLSLAVLP